MDSSLILQGIVSGVLTGCVYALVATGLTLIFGVMRVLNLAHGEFIMLGMYGAWALAGSTGMHPYLTWLVTMPASALLGALVYWFFVRPVLQTGNENSPIVLTVGLLLVLQNLAVYFMSGNFRTIASPLRFTSVKLLQNVFVPMPLLLAAAGSVLATGLLFAFVRMTDAGLALRAVASRPSSAPLAGINVQRVFVTAFAIGCACAGLAASLLAPAFPFSPATGGVYTLTALLVVILGGLGNFAGALAGALIVGVTQAVGALYLPDGIASSLVLCVVIAVLLFRPQGLFTASTTRA
jgi:branched-chain amino acid transport system permease protein